MATYSANGSGSQFFNYMHARVEVTRTDYSTYSAFSVVCKVVSDGGSSSFIAGRATASSSGSYGSYSSEQSVSAYGTTTLKTQTFNVTRGTSAKTLACKASILGGGTGMYAGKYDEATVSVTIPAISYDVPNPPTGASATYVDDSSTTLSWTNGTTTATKPRTATIIERQTDGGAWTQVASVSASATGYTDNGTEQNHSYAWRVAAQNSVGLSTYSTTSTVYTTPAPPASVTLDKTSATTVQVDVTGAAPYATGYDIEVTTDGGSTWSTVATNTSLPYSDTVGAGTVQYRVRSVRGALESAWTLSASLVTVCPPLAPTITASPANPTAYGNSATITWTPNHPDGSTQSAAQIKVTDPGGTSTTYSVTTATTYTLTPNSTGTWTAQVRTKGLDASYGEWSGTISWGVYNPPAVVITTPASDGATITAMPLSIAWTVTDGTGVSAQRVIVTDTSSGQELYNKQLASNVTSLSLSSSDLTLENGGSYGIAVRVMGGSGLITTSNRTFGVSWTPPEVPILAIYEGDGQSATIEVTYDNSGIATTSVDVARQLPDGSLWTVASGIADGASIIDPLPPLGVPVTYVATSSASSGATATTTFTEQFGGRDWVINFGNAAQEFMSFRVNPQAAYSLKQGGTMYHFADGGAGGGRPVWYGTTDRDESGSLRFDTIGKEKADALRGYLDRYPVCWIRDPYGHRWRAHATMNYSHGIQRVWPVSLTWDAERFKEAWNG